MNKLKWKINNIKFRIYCWISRKLGFKIIDVKYNNTRGIGKTKYLYNLAKKKNAIFITTDKKYILNNFGSSNIRVYNANEMLRGLRLPIVIDEGVQENVFNEIISYFGLNNVIFAFK